MLPFPLAYPKPRALPIFLKSNVNRPAKKSAVSAISAMTSASGRRALVSAGTRFWERSDIGLRL